MTNHTPGPWFLRPSLHNVTGATITTETGAVIATARNQDDARMIAASPDMLSALIEIANAKASDDGFDPFKAAERFQEAAKAAIAKARGE